jgi:hypothetical protein
MGGEKDIDEINEQELNKAIDKILGQLTPEQRAYKIIEGFFNATTLTNERCEEFKSWFIGKEYKKSIK